jgi:hemerythrin-like domain-containing protein
MTPPLSMNKVIHHAVLRDLARIEKGLRALTEGDTQRAGEIARTWDHFSFELTTHHEGEDDLLWPYLKSVGVDTTLVGTMASEHAELGLALAAAGNAIDGVRGSGSAAAASTAADAVAKAEEVVRHHFHHEEAQLEPLMEPYVATPEFKAAEKQMRGRMSAKQGGWFFAWLQDGAGPEELDALHQMIPAPVLFMLSKVLGRGYQKDLASLWS